jgi:hypothetical protein
MKFTILNANNSSIKPFLIIRYSELEFQFPSVILDIWKSRSPFIMRY